VRPDNREVDELRPVAFERDFTDMADGSVLIKAGRTHVLCTASVQTDVPRWMKNTGKGWVTAEYSMLPGSSPERVRRRENGRSMEIQRLIGRSLRAVCNMEAMPDVSITVDCDVLSADGGTRTASITGGFIALHDALSRLVEAGTINKHPLTDFCAAISVGIIDGEARLDLPYVEDVNAETDMNVVMTGSGGIIEVQGTAEGAPFSRAELDQLVDLAAKGIGELVDLQKALVATPPTPRPSRD
jgi:ribonuclease PH